MLRIIAVSMSYKLDQEKHSRSFQNVSMTYAEVVREVVKDTPKAAAIFPIGKDRIIGKPLIQYKETDWEFFKRLASHFNSVLIPDCRSGKPWFWFGMREDGQACTFSENEYTIHITDKYFKMGEKHRGFRRSNFFYYTVSNLQNYRIGDTVVYRKNQLFICEKVAEFVRGQIVFTYKIGPKSLIGQHEYYNEQFTGLSLEGTVVKTDHEIVHIHLDIDGERSGTTYPYAWKPISGNLMYCMPKLGTRASLFIPDHDERNARAADSPRVNGGTCPDMGDYNNRYLTTEHYKRMYWFPETMGLVGTGSESTPLQIAMSDENGMLYESHLKTEIIAHDCLRFEAPNVSFHVPLEMHMLRTSSVSAQQNSKLIPTGTGFNSPAPSGDSIQSYAPVPYDDVYNGAPASPVDFVEAVSQTCLALQNMFPSASQVTVYYGWEFCAFSPFDDAPKEGEPFDIWKTVFQCVVGAAVVVACVATAGVLVGVVATAATVGGAMVAMAGVAAFSAGAVAAASYTIANAVHAVSTQKATTWGEFVGMLSANTGATVISTFVANLTPVPFRKPADFALGVLADVGVEFIESKFDKASGEWSRTGEFDPDYDSEGNRLKKFDIVESVKQNLFWDTLFLGAGEISDNINNKRLTRSLESVQKQKLNPKNTNLKDFLSNADPNKTVDSIKTQLYDSCRTDTQRREMRDFIANNRDKPLSRLDSDQLQKLLHTKDGAKEFLDDYKLYDWKNYIPSDLPVDMSQNAASTLADKWKTAKENNDAAALMELEKQVTEWVDNEQRTQSLDYSYAKRENLDGFDFNFPFGKKEFLNNAISSWIPEE